MSLVLATGLPGSYKSGMSCIQTQEWLARNFRWYKKTGIIRPVRSNLVLTKKFTDDINNRKFTLKVNEGVKISDKIKEWNEKRDFLEYWEDPEELPLINDCDDIWEEMGRHVDSRDWEQLPPELRRWLQQHRHRGVNIFGNCQDFADVDVAVRRLTQSLMYLYKIAGSRDPSPTSPPPKIIWGFIAVF